MRRLRTYLFILLVAPILIVSGVHTYNKRLEYLDSIFLEQQTEDEPKKMLNLSFSKRFYIGGIVSDNSTAKYFKNEIDKLNFDGISVSEYNTLYQVTATSSRNPIRDARLVCDKLIPKGVFAIVLGDLNITAPAAAAVSYTGGFYHIPVVGTSSRESAFSDKNIHGSFLRTVPPHSHQADVWVKLLRTFGFSQVVLIHSSDSDGRAILGRLQNHFDNLRDDKGIKLSSLIEFAPGEKNISEKLLQLRESPIRVFLLFADDDDSHFILREANRLDLTGQESVWILTENALESPHAPEGALGIRLRNSQDIQAHITDTLRVVSLSLRRLQEEKPLGIFSPPNTCEEEEPWNITGKELFSAIQSQVLYGGRTGKVAFDQKGDRMYAEYDIMNVQRCYGVSSLNECHTDIHLAKIGTYHYDKKKDSMALQVNESSIRWGHGTNKKPSGIFIPRELKVFTLEEIPFVYSRELLGEPCNETDEAVCYRTSFHSPGEQKRCCYGYCIEMLNALAGACNFTFTLNLSLDGYYGESYFKDGHKVWNGMIGELSNQRADMIVAPLTINPERAQAIDFSKPFKYQGISVLVKKEKEGLSLVSILQPFHLHLWLMLLATVNGIAVLVWVLDSLSPMNKQEGKETDSLRMSEAFWFSWGVILNSGLGEGTPRCLSARVLSMIWAGFAMILVASYTANLAAFLVLDDGVEALSGINDAKLRNPVENFTFATVKSSAVDMFFRRKTEWSNMYRVMEANNYPSADEAIEAVKNGSLQAFIWDSSRLEHAAAQHCDLVTVGEIFGRSGYGIGLKKNSFWNEEITHHILDFHEKGFMTNLDNKWIWGGGPTCPPDRSHAPQRLGLENLEGIFMTIVGGISAGIVLILIEIMYSHYNGPTSQRYARKKAKSKDKQRKCQVHKLLNRSTEDKEETICDNCRSEIPHHDIQKLEEELNHQISEDGHANLQMIKERLESSPYIPQHLLQAPPTDWANYYMEKGINLHSCPKVDLDREDLEYMAPKGREKSPKCSCNLKGDDQMSSNSDSTDKSAGSTFLPKTSKCSCYPGSDEETDHETTCPRY